MVNYVCEGTVFIFFLKIFLVVIFIQIFRIFVSFNRYLRKSFERKKKKKKPEKFFYIFVLLEKSDLKFEPWPHV